MMLQVGLLEGVSQVLIAYEIAGCREQSVEHGLLLLEAQYGSPFGDYACSPLDGVDV
jgi:hypothetical protein